MSTPPFMRAAIASLVLVAIGGALAMSGGSGTAPPSSVPSVVTTPGPTVVAVVPSATSSAAAYPNAAEVKLLNELPAVLRASCVRGRGKTDLAAAG